MLINDILDLSKIESGTVIVDASELRLDELRGYVDRTFKHVAEAKNVEFQIRFEPDMPKSMFTDSKRLQQIIKNLLSNAFKFTHHGQVALTVHTAQSGWSMHNDELNRTPTVLAFSVSDTGIGISPDKQQIVFEAFQQADGSTSRKYGGTGLGLAISRELSRLLGGEIRLTSSPGRGSTFTLYLPLNYTAPRSTRKALAASDVSAANASNRLTQALDKSTQSEQNPPEQGQWLLRSDRPDPPRCCVRNGSLTTRGQRSGRRPGRYSHRRPRSADRGKRSRLRPFLARHGAGKGLQGIGHLARGDGGWR